MTAQEVAEYFGVCIGYVTSNFGKFQKSMIKKHGIRVVKAQDPQKRNYYFLQEAPSRFDLPVEERAVSLIEKLPGKKIFIEADWLGLDEFSFMFLVALFCMPRSQFKGTVMDFMKYVGVKNVKDKVALAKNSFIELSLWGAAALSYMKGDEILIKGIPPEVKKDGRYLSFTINEVIKCVQLSLKYDLKSWGNCLKVLLSKGRNIIDIMETTGIEEKEIKKCLGALE